MISATSNLNTALWQVTPDRIRLGLRRERKFAACGTRGNVASLVLAPTDSDGDRPAIARAGADGQNLSHRELQHEVTLLADRLQEAGVLPGDRVAILVDAGPRWCTAFIAVVHIGAVAVPLDASLPLAELGKQLMHCGAVLILLSASHELTAAGLTGKYSPGCRRLRVDDISSPVAAAPSGPTAARLPCRRDNRDPAVICYTSGTTGCPKGVVVSHGNLISQLMAIRIVMDNGPKTRVVSLLPPSHLFELTAGLLAVLAGGGSVFRTEQPTAQSVLDAMAHARPTSMVVVPLFLSAVKSAIERQLDAAGSLRRGLFLLLRKSALATRSMRLRRFLMWPLLRRFGGRLEYFVCGGAPLDSELARFFESLGVQVLQGYGMTEASPVVAANGPHSNRIGSVGRPLPGTEVRASEEGEILVRGPQVMLRYHRNARATAAAIDAEGWLHTGDLGELDKDGYLYVNGRHSSRIVLACGEKVQPEEVETAILRSARISECGVIGMRSRSPLHNGSEEVCAVVVPTGDDDPADPRVLQQALRMEVSRCCAGLAQFKRPTRVIVRRQPLPATASRKLRRRALGAWLEQSGGNS
jgi:long-chain acyl-CoA synthetase